VLVRRVQYTFLGGEDNDSAFGITVDTNNNVYVTGSTRSSTFPVTRNAQQSVISGGGDFYTTDAFVTKIQSNGTSLVYSTYLGGTGDDSGASVAVDNDGAIYLTGATLSDDFPIVCNNVEFSATSSSRFRPLRT